ncbi:MAG TPA: hypothetical protein VK578_21795 [Edaphobacter sp.]|jgi:hypothetical protein|nr:hypothetical protein [Edaphobacter sp.]
MLIFVRKFRLILQPAFLPALFLPLAISGCTRTPAQSVEASRAITTQQQQEIEAARQQMELIPPPSKTRYMAVKSLSTWENPYLTVQGGMVTLHVVLADANTSGLGEGGLLRPMGARRQDLNVRISELSTALNAIPESSWPYGRVVAIEEAHEVPVSARPTVRRNVETVIKTLNDLGVVVYEWNEGGRS